MKVSRWLEKAIIGAFVINRVLKEYPNIFCEKGQSYPLSPSLAEGSGQLPPLPPYSRHP